MIISQTFRIEEEINPLPDKMSCAIVQPAVFINTQYQRFCNNIILNFSVL